MYEVLCEKCWHTEAIEESAKPDHGCPECGAENVWLGPFSTAERISRRDSWPVLTSPFYVGAGQVDRRINPR